MGQRTSADGPALSRVPPAAREVESMHGCAGTLRHNPPPAGCSHSTPPCTIRTGYLWCVGPQLMQQGASSQCQLHCWPTTSVSHLAPSSLSSSSVMCRELLLSRVVELFQLLCKHPGQCLTLSAWAAEHCHWWTSRACVMPFTG